MTARPPATRAEHQGAFIAFEGGEASGKTTQSARLAARLAGTGRRVVRTREPGGTPAAEAIRALVLDPAFAGLDPRAEALLFAAARAEHAARVIRPAVARGDIVVCDRYIDSSVAYQGIGRGLGADQVRDLSWWATSGLAPDLTIVLDADPAVALARIGQRDRLEAEPLAYHARVRQAFADLAAADPARYLLIPAGASIADAESRAWARVAELLHARD